MDIGADYRKTLLFAATDNAQVNNEPTNSPTPTESKQEPPEQGSTKTQDSGSVLNEVKTANNVADFKKYQLLSQVGERKSNNGSNNIPNQISNKTTNISDSSSIKSTSNSTNASSKEAVYVLIPKGKEKLSDYNILSATAQQIYEKEGVKVSKAAIEELVGRNIVVELKDFKPTYLRDEKGKLALDENKQPIRAYLVNLDPSFKQALLKFQPEAERITKAGIPAVHDLTDEQRFDIAVSKAVEKYGFIPSKEALLEIVSPINIGFLAASRVAPGPVSIVGAALFTVNGAPEIYQLGIDAKRLIYAPTKPSDLDLAADKLAQLYQIGVVAVGTEVLNKGIGKAESIIDKTNIPSVKLPNVSSKFDSLLPPPSGPALATANQAPINWRMPIFEPTLRPAVPGSNLSRPNLPASNFSSPGIRENISSNSFGGPLARPLPFRSQSNNGENKTSDTKTEEVDKAKTPSEDNGINASTDPKDFEQIKANAYSSIDSARQLLDKNPKLKGEFDHNVRELQKQWDEASEVANDPELKEIALEDFNKIKTQAESINSNIKEKLPKSIEEKTYILEGKPAPDEETILNDESNFTRTGRTHDGRQIYTDEKGKLYYVDNYHFGKNSEIEVFDKQHKHLGTMNVDGTPKKPPVPGRRLED